MERMGEFKEVNKSKNFLFIVIGIKQRMFRVDKLKESYIYILFMNLEKQFLKNGKGCFWGMRRSGGGRGGGQGCFFLL